MAHISKSSLLLPWYDIMTRITNTHSADRKHTSWPPSLKAVKALKTRARCKHVSDEYPRRYRYKCVLSQFVLRYEACQGPLCRIVLTAPYPSHPFIVAKLEGFALQFFGHQPGIPTAGRVAPGCDRTLLSNSCEGAGISHCEGDPSAETLRQR